MCRVYIIDDESKAIDNLKFLIKEELPGVTAIGSHTNPLIAIQEIHGFKPDLIFLDVQMPHLDGFGVLNALGSFSFEVIFTTAYEQYAIEAIRKKAIDYLLKPIDSDDLKNSFNRFLEKRKKERTVNLNDQADFSLSNDHLSVQVMEGVHFVKFSDIIRLEANGNYTKIYTKENKPIVSSKTLKIYDEILAPKDFFRVHHSHLINLKMIASFLKNEFLLLVDGTEVPVSRRKKNELKVILGLE